MLQRSPEEVVAAYLFGSRGRGDATPKSDIDLGILLRREPAPALRGIAGTLAGQLEDSLGLEVDAVVLNTAPPDLVHRVLRDGQILLDRDRSARIRFEVRSRNAYFDLAPLRRMYRRVPT
jgi:hypothetical protein